MNIGSDSDTFNEFTYEEEILDEIENYTILKKEPLTQAKEPPRRTIDEYFGTLANLSKKLTKMRPRESRQGNSFMKRKVYLPKYKEIRRN
ncbi:12383_t:CDS:2, partial [Gigaspora margarita]